MYPVRVGDTDGHSLLRDVQWVDGSSDGMELLHAALTQRFGASGSFSWDAHRVPYPGLAAFEPEDAAVFFGRDEKIDELLRHLEAPLGRGRCIAVIGASGTGKSSLVRAGLLPRLRRMPDRWTIVPPFTPGDRPLAALERALAAAGRERVDLADAAGLVEAARDLAGAGSRRSVLLVIDQAEELATLASEAERARFLACARGALGSGSPLWVIATFRTEFLGSSLRDARIAGFVDESVLLGPLERARIPEVIEGPARAAGIEFEPGLVGRMVEDTHGGDALPLLAYTLQQLYDSATDDGRITHAEYDSIGGVLGALRTRADVVTDQLARDGHGAVVLPTLLKLARLDADDEPARRRVSRRDLTPAEEAVVEAFVDARLLTSDATAVAVAHEALLRGWPPLTEAIRGSREQLRLRSQLERLAAEWDGGGRRDAYLLRAERLDGARRLLEADQGQTLGSLSDLERAYYDASVGLERRERRAARRATGRV